jgi:broad specificity phosphatase PhoE
MRILLARHGETSWNAEGRYQGRTFDIPLSEEGRAQALALGSRLEGVSIARAVASPLLRARQTAELALGAKSVDLVLDEGLVEVSHGSWEGLLYSEVMQRDVELRRGWRDTPHLVRPPGGESLQEVQDRTWPALCRACEGLGSEDTVLIVAHDGANRTLLCKVLGLPLSRVWSFRQAPACLNLLEGPDAEHLTLVRLNDATHLTPLFGEVVHRQV